MDQSLLVPSLASTPRLLRALCGDAAPEQIWALPTAGEWSIGDVIRHLLAADQRVFLPRLQRMLAEARPTTSSISGRSPRREPLSASDRRVSPLASRRT